MTPYSWTFTTDGCAGAVNQPDLAAKRGATGALVGDDVYTAGGAGQTRLLRTPPGRTATFYTRIQNDGNESDVFRVTGQGTLPRRFSVQYFDGTTNVTGRVVAGTYRTPSLAPGAARSLRVVIRVADQAPAGASVTRLITARSANDHAVVDGVKLTVRRVAAPRTRTEAAVADVPPPSTAELAEAARYAQVCLLD